MSKRGLRIEHLQDIFNALNLVYFDNALQGTKLTWMRRTRGPRPEIKFAWCYMEQNHIAVNPILLAPEIPRWYMVYVIFHEMLHLLYPPKKVNGEWEAHHQEFVEAERRFVHIERAQALEEKLVSGALWEKLRTMDTRTISLPRVDVEE